MTSSDTSGPDKLIAIARMHGDRWTVVYRGGTERLYFDDEMQARMFMLGLLDGGR